jgi:hypothetical protein
MSQCTWLLLVLAPRNALVGCVAWQHGRRGIAARLEGVRGVGHT